MKDVLYWFIFRMIFGSMFDFILKTRNFCNVFVASLLSSISIILNIIFVIILDLSFLNVISVIIFA